MAVKYGEQVERKPDWWETWLPDKCANGHDLKPGTVSLSWVQCDCAGGGQGHQVRYCREQGCHWHMYPPEHVGPEPGAR